MRFVLLLCFFTISVYSQEFPTNFGIDEFKAAKLEKDAWDGKLLALKCRVGKIEKGVYDKPYYQCFLDDENYIWVGSLMGDKKKLKEKDDLKILGYFSVIKKENVKFIPKNNQDGFHLLVFAVINISNKDVYHLQGVDMQFQNWKKGVIE